VIGSFFAGHRKMASLARELDGFADGGLVWEHVIQPLNEAANQEATMVAKATRELQAIVKRAYPGKQTATLYKKVYIKEINASLGKMNAIMVGLNWGNETNRQRIRMGRNWNDSQVQAVLDTLDGKDWRFIQDVWDHLDTYWPAIKAKQERIVGVAPARVEPTPFPTPFGLMRGGYFPLKYDDRESAKAGQLVAANASELQKQAAYVRATTNRPHTKERASNVKLPVRLDFGPLFEHVTDVIHDLTHHEALIDVGRVLGHAQVSAAIYETQGDLVYKQFINGMSAVAQGDKPAINGFERGLNYLRSGATIAGLGWNLWTTMLQPLGLTQSIVRIGPRWVLKGMKHWAGDAARFENTAQWIESKSELMANRFRTSQREVNEIRNSLGVNTGQFSGYVDEVLSKTTFDLVTRQGIADSYFWMIGVAQRVADIPTWLGQYEKSMAAGETEERAIQLADQAVLDSQAGGQVKDLAAVQRGGPALKLWTAFYSFFSATYNLAVESRNARSLKNPADVGRMAADYFMLFIVPATITYGLATMLGKENDKDKTKGLLRAIGSYVMGTMVGVRELSGTVAGYYGYEGPAGARVFGAAGKAYKQIEQGELDAAALKALNTLGGILLHYPAAQVQRTVTGIAALAEGETHNPLAILTGPPVKKAR